MTTRPKLELVALRKEFRDGAVPAVDGIDLTLHSGETLALLGPSGCGKSTTLNMIVGLDTPTSGDIQIDGQSVVGIPAGKRNVGLVFQDYAVFTAMTVRAKTWPSAWRCGASTKKKSTGPWAKWPSFWAWAIACAPEPKIWEGRSCSAWPSGAPW